MLFMMMRYRAQKWAMVFATVPDEHETNYVSPVSTKFQPDIQSLASSALLSIQSLVAGSGVGVTVDLAEGSAVLVA
jgi:hypothetical protein